MNPIIKDKPLEKVKFCASRRVDKSQRENKRRLWPGLRNWSSSPRMRKTAKLVGRKGR